MFFQLYNDDYMGKREGAILLFFCLWYNTYGWNSFWSFYLHLYDSKEPLKSGFLLCGII
nr:MAG TPA: hypothetical protein [Caudoviricetes sp.]